MLEQIINTSPAKNLINKFYYQLPNNGYLNEGLLSCDRRYKEAITCAIICVDEIINLLGDITNNEIDYWESVKQELIQIQNDNRSTT